jgi:hypothetical protein
MIPDDCGQVCVKEGLIEFSSFTYGHWTLQMDDIVVIGKLITEEFPFETVYCVLVQHDGFWKEVPWGASGFEFFVVELERHFQCTLLYMPDVGLASSVLWPQSLAGEPLFEFFKYRRKIWERIKWWWYPSEVGKRLAPEVARYVGASAMPGYGQAGT